MQLSDALASQVTSSSRSRGLEYFQSGAVVSLHHQDGIIEATVAGNVDYDVVIEPVGTRLRVSCTCPHFVDHLQVCKHVWATVLAAEAEDIPLLEPGVAPGRIKLELVADPYDIEDEFLDDDDVGWLQPPPLAKASGVSTRKPGPVPAWQTLLESIARHYAPPASLTHLPGRAEQLLYVIDIEASLGANGLVLELMTRDRKVNGDWGKPKPARVMVADVGHFPHGPDREILERLVGARPETGYGYLEYGDLSRLRLTGTPVRDTLPLICADDRCFARVHSEDPVPAAVPQKKKHQRRWQSPPVKPKPTTLLPLRFDDGPAWCFGVTIVRDEPGRVYRIEGLLMRGDQRMAVSEPLLVLADGVLVTRDRVARLDHGGAFGWLAALRNTSPIVVPLDQRAALLDAILIGQPSIVETPEELRVEVEHGNPRPLLRLAPVRLRPDRLRADLSFDYGGELIAPSALPNPLLRTAAADRIVRRDFRNEAAHLETLRRAGFRPEWVPDAGQQLPLIAAHLLPAVVRSLVAEGWHVEAKGVRYRHPAGVSLAVTSGIDWFELEGHVGYGDQRVELPALLAAAQRGEEFVTLGDGTMGLLPEEWLRKHGALAKLGSNDGGRLRFKSSQVALLDALLAAQPAATWDEAFARSRRELQAFDGIAPMDPPESFNGTLRAYQREGLGWLVFLRRFGFGGCLADDMGLGKTVMVLALLDWCRSQHADAGRAPSLVVAPRSLVFNWRQEAARFTPGLRVLDYTGSDRSAARDAIPSHDLVLTTYGTLRRDAAHLASLRFEYVILDEAQAIKNAASASAKAARLLTAAYRLALSGTPIENHLGELWSLFEFLNPGLLGSSSAFVKTGAGRNIDDETVSILSRGLRPFILRRTKDQVAPELPPKTEQTLYCELERPQRTLYNELRDHYRGTLLAGANGGALGRAKLQVLEALLRLRQAACHPGLIDRARGAEPSAKLDVLIPQIAEAVEEGHKTLVFSQFTSLLALLRTRLDADGVAYEYLDGQTRDRESRVARFQTDPQCRLFLISLKAGGVGLNLTAAEYVFLLDPWWNPAVEAQAIDRTHRIGQERHVFAYRLIARDTVEERVLELQQSKRQLADAILTADESLIRNLKREDLELLLS
jgi:superfamily II DNA or RNA helicase